MKKVLLVFVALLSVSKLHCNNVNWSFPPTIISTINQNASDPQIVIDPNGNAVAAWVENGIIKSSAHHLNMSWSSSVNVSGSGASFPRLVADNNGNATLVWLENGIVKAASKPFNGNWSSATSLSLSGALSPEIGIDSAGNVVTAWARGNNVETSTKLFGGNWQNRVTITSSSAAFPKVAIGGSGVNQRVVIVWQGISSSTNVIYSATKLISGSWTAQQIISDTTHNAVNPDVSVDLNQNTIAVWYQYDVSGTNYSNVVVNAASRLASGTWLPSVHLSNPGIRNPATLIARVGFDGLGNGIAIWNNSFNDETFSIESSIYQNGNWTTPLDIVDSNLFAFDSDLGITSFGDVLAAYMYYNGSVLQIQSIESDIDAKITNPWSVPINFSTGDKNGYPRIAAAISGNVINAAAVWIKSGSVNQIAAATGARTLVLPPSNLSVVQSVNNFGFFNDYYNTLSWQASADPNVVGYLIFRNGVFIEQVGSDVLQITDHNRTQNGAVTYGVAAINAQLSQSRMVTVNFP